MLPLLLPLGLIITAFIGTDPSGSTKTRIDNDRHNGMKTPNHKKGEGGTRGGERSEEGDGR